MTIGKRAALLLALLPACPAAARSTLGDASPGPPAASYQDVVRLPPDPAGIAWHQVGGAVTPDQLITEWVPEGQTDLDWTQNITLKTLPHTRDPGAIVQRAVGLMRDICGQFSVTKTPPRQQRGDVQAPGVPVPVFAVTDITATCQAPNLAALRKKFGTENVAWRRYEVTWYRIMQGDRQNFIVQRTWHADAIDALSPLSSKQTQAEWTHWRTSITLRRVGF